jgi:hypothetical protein
METVGATWMGCSGLQALAPAPGLGPPLRYLRRDWARPSNVCAGTGPTPATSAPGLDSLLPTSPGLGSPLPNHTGTGPPHAISVPGLGPPHTASAPGLVVQGADKRHAISVVGLGLDMLAAMKQMRDLRHQPISIRIGIHSGPVICHICTGTGLNRCRICARTGPTAASFATKPRSPRPHPHRDWARPLPHPHRDGRPRRR